MKNLVDRSDLIMLARLLVVAVLVLAVAGIAGLAVRLFLLAAFA